MSQLQVSLTDANSRRAADLAEQTGRTPTELVNEAFDNYVPATPASLSAWREALNNVKGIWADRDDLPDIRALRSESNRRLERFEE